jgi:hypothetical protein
MKKRELSANSFRQSVILIHTEEKKIAGGGATQGQAEVEEPVVLSWTKYLKRHQSLNVVFTGV